MVRALPARESLHRRYPLVLETALLVVTLVALQVWLDGTYHVAQALLPGGEVGSWAFVLSTAVPYVLAVGAFVAAYARLRGYGMSLSVPDVADLPVVVSAVAVPPVFVFVTDVVAGTLGTHYSSLAGTWYAESVSVEFFAAVALPKILLVGAAMGLVGHAVVQQTYRDVLDPAGAVAATTVTVLVGTNDFGSPFGFVTAGLGGLVFAAVVVASVGLFVYARERQERRWLHYVCSVPLILVGVGVVQTVLADVDGPASALFLAATLAVYALAAVAYERTDSVWVPMAAYAAFAAAGEAVTFFLEAGVGP